MLVRKSSSCSHVSCVCVGVAAPEWSVPIADAARVESVPAVDGIGDRIQVFNTSEDDGPRVTFTPEEWKDFVEGVKRGEFDIP